MTWWERWAFNALHVIVAGSGLVYFWMKNVMVSDDPFAIINHPWQSTSLSLHLLASPFFIAFFGMLFRSHSLRKILSSNPANRRTGWTSLVSFSAMAISGYLIQIAATSWLISMAIWTHIVTSLFFVVGYTVHLVICYRLIRLRTRDLDAAPLSSPHSPL